jgi:hypothetical protein
MGMSVTQGIVNAHGGETGLFSDGEGQGSNFFFSLPIYITTSDEDASEEALEAPAKQGVDEKERKMKVFSGLRVLVVTLFVVV